MPKRQSHPYRLPGDPGPVTPSADDKADHERAQLAGALQEAHRMVSHPAMVAEPLTSLEREHMRQLTPHVAQAGTPEAG